MSMRGIYRDNVYTSFHQCRNPVHRVFAHADARSYNQAAALVFVRIGIFQLIVNIFYGNQTYKFEFFIYNWQFLDPVLKQDLFRLLEVGFFIGSDQLVFGHQFFHLSVEVFLILHVAVGNDPNQCIFRIHNRQTGDFEMRHHFLCFGQCVIFRQSHGI